MIRPSGPWCARLLGAALGGILACGDSTPPASPDSIVVQPSGLTLLAHGASQLAATVMDASGSPIEGAPLVFESSDEAIVTVSPSGLVTSVGPLGQTRVTVASGDVTADVAVAVVPPAAGILVEPDHLTLEPGQQAQLVVTVTNDHGELVNAAVTYFTHDPFIATVDQAGAVVATGLGSTLITISSGELTPATIQVMVVQVPATLTVTPDHLDLAPGFTDVLTATLLDTHGAPIADPPVSFASSNPGVVTVGAATGLVRGVSNGTAVITAQSGSLQQTVDVTVGGTPPGAILATTQLHGQVWGVRTRGDRYFVTALEDASGMLYVGQGSGFGFPTAIPMGGVPTDVEVNQAGTRAYVAGASHGTVVEGVVVVDLTTNTLIDAIPSAHDDRVLSVALSADESRLIVGTLAGLEVITLATGNAVSVPGVSGVVNAISRHPSAPLLYATVAQGILELNATTGAVLRTFSLSAFPLNGTAQGSAVAPDGSLLYFLDDNRGTLRAWDLVANTPDATIDGVGGFGLAVSPDGQFLYAAVGPGVILVDRATLTPVRTVLVTGGARRIAFRSDGVAVVTNDNGWVDFLR